MEKHSTILCLVQSKLLESMLFYRVLTVVESSIWQFIIKIQYNNQKNTIPGAWEMGFPRKGSSGFQHWYVKINFHKQKDSRYAFLWWLILLVCCYVVYLKDLKSYEAQISISQYGFKRTSVYYHQSIHMHQVVPCIKKHLFLLH